MSGIYARRNHKEQGEHYLRHMQAMTAYDFRHECTIAAELAHRDIAIEELKSELAARHARLIETEQLAARYLLQRKDTQIENEELKARLAHSGVELQRAVAEERERICAAIKDADDLSSAHDYMLDSDDCIAVARGLWQKSEES